MPFNECTPDGVIADILASQAARGVEIPDSLVLNGTANDILSFVKRSQIEAGSILDGAPASLQKIQHERIGNYWSQVTQDLKHPTEYYQTEDGVLLARGAGKAMMHTFMNPSQIIGEDVVAQLDDILIDFAQKGIFDGQEYQSAVGRFFKSVDTSDFTDEQMIYFNEYRTDLSKSSRFGGYANDPLGSKFDALVKGTVQLSPRVVGGNFIEPFMKGIPLYGRSFLQGWKDLGKLGNGNIIENLFAEIPELKEQGLYGLDVPNEELKGVIERASGFMDRPAKNLMYFVGVADGGNAAAGRRAIQQVMFLPRMADVPLSYRRPFTRAATRLLNYSIGTYNLFGSTLLAAKDNPTATNVNRALGLLATYGTVSGIPALMKAQGHDVEEIPVLGGAWKVLADLSSVNLPNRLFIPAEQFKNKIMAPVAKTIVKIGSGQWDQISGVDIFKTASALAFMRAPSGSAAEELASNQLLYRAMTHSIKGISGEEAADEAFMEAILPGFNK